MAVRTTGKTRIVGLLGWPVTHSLSPVMHNAAFAALDLDFHYVAFPVPPEQVGQALGGIRALGIRGCNVTVPHKQSVVEHLDEVSPFAKRVGAVNTIWVDDDGRMNGDNTDGPGLAAYLEQSGARLVGQRAIVIGAGGSARAVVAGLADAGCCSVVVLNRTQQRAQDLVDTLSCGDCELGAGRFPQDVSRLGPDADVVVQCTTVGMGPAANELAWDPDTPFRPDQVVCDLVYEPQETRLLAMARRQGARALGGLGMLIHQGALSFQRWTGHQAPIEVMVRAVREQGN